MEANVNDVIQVNERFMREEWVGCLMIVHEAKEWGVIAGLKVPMQGTAYLRQESSISLENPQIHAH